MKRKSSEKADIIDRNVTNSGSLRKKKEPVLKLEEAPHVNSLKDLIDMGKNLKIYKNVDNIVLWRITPYLEQLNNMIGMTSLKESILYQVLYYLQNMHNRNINEEYLHTMIMGSPGSGKTTVSRIIGNIYKSLGILSNDGPFITAHRDDFIAGYLGQTSIKTRKLLESCIGGILFVDEVYSLGPGQIDKDSFSKEAIETITAFLSEHKNDFCFIGAGYEEDVRKCFFSANQGLERRFQWVHKIEKYTSDDLAEIMIQMINNMKWIIGVDKKDISALIKKNIGLFDNVGGDIECFISKCKMVHSKRVFTLDNSCKFVLTIKDLENGIKLIEKYKLKKEIHEPPPGMFL